MAMHFQIQLTQGAQRYLSCYLVGANSILIHSYLIPCFVIYPKTTFMTIQLWRNVLALSRRGKFYLDPLTSHPKVYNYT
jgi:hypothetical protein